jgi:hypothetical protein
VFYFFHRAGQYIQCEIRLAADSVSEYELAITEPSGVERVERWPSSDAVHQRWIEIQERFQQDGWWGPSGRD